MNRIKQQQFLHPEFTDYDNYRLNPVPPFLVPFPGAFTIKNYSG